MRRFDRATTLTRPGSAAARRLWCVSNGRAEDAIATRILASLRAGPPGWSVHALPLVGEGRAYAAMGVEVLGPQRSLPSDGLTLHHPRLAWQDIRAGLLGVTLSQAVTLWAGRGDAVLVVGDVYAQAMASLLRVRRRFVVQPLVSLHMAEVGAAVPWNRAFMERIRAPELALLRRAEAVYPRDEATAAWLRSKGVAAVYLGNPIMDALDGTRLGPWPELPTVALLPGSRAHGPMAVRSMLAALACLADEGLALAGAVAWTHGAVPPVAAGWREEPERSGRWPSWCRRGVQVAWVEGRFGDVLATAHAALGTAGTAHEQAVGRGLPVVTFEVPPGLGRAFLANQARLLGGAVEIVAPDAPSIAAGVRRALFDPERRAAARRVGAERLGGAGGGAAIGADVGRRLTS